MKPTVIPERDDLVGRFWGDVRSRLTGVHDLTDDQADLGIARYRGFAEQHLLGDTVYNRGAARVAETIHREVVEEPHVNGKR
jgi:hypothetical protein